MKVLILAGGRGKRLKSFSDEINKCMLRLAGKPLIEYSLDNASAINPEEIVIVVGYLAEQIINEYGNMYRGVRIRYVIQKEQKGLVHAIEMAVPCIGESDFMLLLADEILLKPNHSKMLRQYRSEKLFALCGVTIPKDPEAIRNTYAIFQDESSRIFRLIEKPRKPISEYQGTGNIIFHNSILKYIDFTPINLNRNEKELPDLVQCAIDDGHMVKSFLMDTNYLNINTADDIIRAEKEVGSFCG